jgi:hypothetical protein
VALDAGGDTVRFHELTPVRIRVALFALCRRSGEIRIHQFCFKVRRFVAVNASYGTMCTDQRKRSLRMVELWEISPTLSAVASRAATGFTVRARNAHAFLELVAVRIVMAARASQVFKVVRRICLSGWLQIGGVLVTVCARCGNVPASKHEARVFVACQRERRGSKTLNVVAVFAAIEVRRGRKLILMLVTMTIQTTLKLDLEQRLFPFRYVAPCALYSGVFAFERILRWGVFLNGEFGWLPFVDGVTGCALPSIGSLRELTLVRIGVMAIHALWKNQWLFEITIDVALPTAHGLVFAE